MNKDIAKLWIDALRSGEYKQTRGCLKANDSFCCLGVLCDLYKKVAKIDWQPFGDNLRYTFDNKEGCLPESVMKWGGYNNI